MVHITSIRKGFSDQETESTTSTETKKTTSSVIHSTKRRPGTSPKKVSTISRFHFGSDGEKQSVHKKSVGKAQSVSSVSELCTAQSGSKKSTVTARNSPLKARTVSSPIDSQKVICITVHWHLVVFSKQVLQILT